MKRDASGRDLKCTLLKAPICVEASAAHGFGQDNHRIRHLILEFRVDKAIILENHQQRDARDLALI